MKKSSLRLFLFVLGMLLLAPVPASAFMTRAHVMERANLSATFMKMFAAKDFATLDAGMNKIQQGYEEGKWEELDLQVIFVRNLAGADPGLAAIFDQWVKAYPRSYAAHVARGAYFMNMAQALAGQGPGGDYAARAINDDQAALKLAAKPVTAYMNLITLYSLSGDLEGSRKMLDLANAVAPLNTLARFQYLSGLDRAEDAAPGTYLAAMQKFVAEVRASKLDANKADGVIRPYFTRLLNEGQYAELDREMNALQQDYESGKIDDVTLVQSFSVLNGEAPAPEEKLNAWVQAYPQSYAARQARCAYYIGAAEKARGDKFMAETSDKEKAGMALYFQKAVEDSKAAITLAKKPLLTYAAMITIGGFTGNTAVFKEMLEKADEADPKNYLVRKEYMQFLQTRWGGSPAAMEAFMTEVKSSGMRDYKIIEFENMVLGEKLWLADRTSESFSNIGQVETGF